MPVLQPARLLPKYCCAELEDTFASQRQSCLSTLIRVSICWQNVVRNLKVLQVSNSSSVVSIIFLYCTWGKKYSNEMPKMGLGNWHLSIRDSWSWVFRKKCFGWHWSSVSCLMLPTWSILNFQTYLIGSCEWRYLSKSEKQEWCRLFKEIVLDCKQCLSRFLLAYFKIN